MNVAIIPARGGSKRIPRKNIKTFCGQPIIGYAIETAKLSGLFDRIVISTDDAEIAIIAKNFGAEVPFFRPEKLSDDYAGTKEVIQHCIGFMENSGYELNDICCLYPCTPLLRAQDLIVSYQKFKKTENTFCFPVIEFPSSVMRSLIMEIDGNLSPLFPENVKKRTQDTTQAFYDAGQFYWGNNKRWLSSEPIHMNAVGHIMNKWKAIDIDTPEDWSNAETLFRIVKEGSYEL